MEPRAAEREAASSLERTLRLAGFFPASRTPCLALSAHQMGSLINSVHLRRVSLNQASPPSETPNRRPHPAGP